MAHQVIKFVTVKDKDNPHEVYKTATGSKRPLEAMSLEDAKSWHLVYPLHDGDSTACGQVYWEYERTSKSKDKGGITCPDCLKAVQFYKSVKL